jgi:transposase
MAGTKGMRHYTQEIKLEAVRLHEEDGLTYAEVANRLGLRKPERIEVWVRQYKQEGEAGLSKKGSGRPRKAHSDPERLAQLEMENALLKKYHTELRKVMLARRDIGSSNTTGRTTW